MQLIVLIQLVAAWFAADFVTGVVHWIEDRYMTKNSLNFLVSIADDNDLHHRKPTAMTISSAWVNMQSAALVGWPLALILFFAGAPIFVWATVFFSTFGNLVHRFSHVPKKQLPRWIRGLQEFGLFISHEHHESHHRREGKLIDKDQATGVYCPMTDWVNPLLDRVLFWDRAESLLRIIGIEPAKPDVSQ